MKHNAPRCTKMYKVVTKSKCLILNLILNFRKLCIVVDSTALQILRMTYAAEYTVYLLHPATSCHIPLSLVTSHSSGPAACRSPCWMIAFPLGTSSFHMTSTIAFTLTISDILEPQKNTKMTQRSQRFFKALQQRWTFGYMDMIRHLSSSKVAIVFKFTFSFSALAWNEITLRQTRQTWLDTQELLSKAGTWMEIHGNPFESIWIQQYQATINCFSSDTPSRDFRYCDNHRMMKSWHRIAQDSTGWCCDACHGHMHVMKPKNALQHVPYIYIIIYIYCISCYGA